MKVVQVNSVVNMGSTGRIAEDLGIVLMKHGHESYIAVGRGGLRSKSVTLKIGNQYDVVRHGLVSSIWDRHGFGSKNATISFLKRLEVINPDIILLHNIHGYYIHIGLLFEWLANSGVKIFWTLHDCWAFTGHCTYYESPYCGRWKTECFECPRRRSYPKSIFMDQSRRNFHEKRHFFNLPKDIQIITPSRWLADQVKVSFLRNYPVHVIHNGIDLGTFASSTNSCAETIYDQRDKTLVLGVASVWDKRKGLNDFFHLREMLDEKYVITLIGLTKEVIRSLPKGIIGLPRTSSIEELVAWYSIARVFVNPTWQDNFPTTNIEALACGTPVVTYATGGSPEALDDKTGIVVERGDINALARAVVTLSAVDRSHISDLCRSRAVHYFDREERYLDYLNLFTAATA
jgi:putative colanic acid biosynthesis glycosyltransferase